MTRPIDGGNKHSLPTVREAVEPVWTFYAARLLSPALATMLAPFQFLDELANDPLAIMAPPSEALATFVATVRATWLQHHLPTIPDLRFCAGAVRLGHGARLERQRSGSRYSGAFAVAAPDELELVSAGPLPEMMLTRSHRGPRLSLTPEGPARADALAIVPAPPPGAPADERWVRAIGAEGVVIFRLPPGTPGNVGFRVDLRVQDARAALVDEREALLQRGVASLGYFRTGSRTGPSRTER